MARTPGLGSKIRSLRQRAGLTQAKLADMLDVSASYVNLIEHDRRNVSAQLLIKLAQLFDLDLKAFSSDGDERLAGALVEVFGDAIFDGQGIAPEEVQALASGSPALARAVVKLYEAFGQARESARNLASRVSEGEEAVGVESWRLPSEEVSDLIQHHRNYFPELETGTAELFEQTDLESHEVYRGLAAHLARHLGIDVRVVNAGSAELHGAVRRYDPKRRRITLSEVLPTRSRIFQLAHVIGLITKSGVLDRIAADERLTTDESRRLCRVALANYYAAAVLMPYERFLDAARAIRYDIVLLGHRFRTSFEQVCHRLTTLQRPGATGVPFHFVRVDIAGNISKRFSATGMRFARFSAACPRWNVHAAFLTPGRIRTQVSQMLDGQGYFSVSRTVTKGEGGYRSPRTLHAVELGCEVRHARDMVYADGIDLDHPEAAVPIGVTCRLCERTDCEQRAFPPIQKPIAIDENARGFSFYAPVKD